MIATAARIPGDPKNYVLGLLTVVLLFNNLDRVALYMMLPDIKNDLHASDTQLGFLGGISFALFYSLMGLPIARWADRGNRVLIIVLTTLAWSVAVALCGFVSNLRELIAVRVIVAIGEAGCIPTSFSLLADYFVRADRPRAAAIYGTGASLSALFGLALAGWIDQLYGWRFTFVAIGVLGVVLAIVTWCTVRDPRSCAPCPSAAATEHSTLSPRIDPSPSLRTIGRVLVHNFTYVLLLCALSGIFFVFSGVGQWVPSLFIHKYGLGSGVAGTWLGIALGGGGLIGSLLGGLMSSRYARGNEARQLRAVSYCIVIAGVAYGASYLAPNVYLALTCLSLGVVGVTFGNGPIFAVIQSVVPESMRALSIALVYLFANLLGAGFGPLCVGFASDLLHASVGTASLNYALPLLTPIYLLVAWFVLRAGRLVTSDLASVSVSAR